MTTEPIMMPAENITDVELAFPANGVSRLPAWDRIPKEYQDQNHPRCNTVEVWFGMGLKMNKIVPKKGIDQIKAFRHLKAIMGSYEPKHEHKIAGVAYLIDQWFEKFDVEVAK